MKQIYFSSALLLFFTISIKAQIVISEIFYNIPGSEDAEFIELYNAGSTSVDLTGYSFSAGVTHTFSSGTINANEYFVIATDSSVLNSLFGSNTADAQWTWGGLSNAGETISLIDNTGALVDTVTYDDTADWGSEADGDGSSLELIDTTLDNSLASSWTPSEENTGIFRGADELKATPGAAYNSTLSTNIFELDKKLRIFPNPTTDFIKVLGLTSKESYTLYNILGTEIKKGVISNNEQIDIRELTNGLYFLKFDNGNSIKFIKK